MKKVLILLAVMFYLISCGPGNDSKTTVSADSTKTDTTKIDTTVTPGPPAPNISKYIISDSIANLMINHKPLLPRTPNVIDSSIKNLIVGQYSNAVIYSIKAKYRDEDVARYTSTRGFRPGSDTGKVKNYKTVIFKVVITTGAATTETIYYDCVTVCPPPDGSDCKWTQVSSTSASKQ